jgi:hypothetical protein
VRASFNWEGVGTKSPSRQARISAMKIKKTLTSLGQESRPLWVQGIVVLADPRAEVTEKKPPEHVKVVRLNELANYIKGQPKRFEAWEIGQIEAEIRNKIQPN